MGSDRSRGTHRWRQMKVWRRPCDQLEDGARERPDVAVLGCVVFTLDDFWGHCDTGGITPCENADVPCPALASPKPRIGKPRICPKAAVLLQ